MGAVAIFACIPAFAAEPGAMPVFAPGSGVTSEFTQSALDHLREKYGVPGAAIAVVKDGKLLLAAGSGVREVDKEAPVDADTMFQLASVSKTFTAAAVAAMVDTDKLKWEQPARKVLPDFKLEDTYATEWVNARDLLTHRAGFPGFFGDLFDRLGHPEGNVLHRIRFVEPAYSFRDHPEYSNIGFFLAGELVANSGGGSFEEVLDDRILTPTGMSRTGNAMALLSESGQNAAKPHAVFDGAVRAVPANYSELFVSAGGLTSTANDLAKYIEMLVNGGKSGQAQVLSTGAIDELFAPVITSDIRFAEFAPISNQTGFTYAPGWGVYYYNGAKVLEKGGALDGIRTIVVLVPEKKFGIAVLSNLNLTVLPEAFRAALLQQEFGREGEPDLQPEIFSKGEQIEEMLLQPEPNPKNPAPASFALAEYEGTYVGDLFGQWKVVAAADGKPELKVIAGPAGFTGQLTYWDGDTFHLLWPGVISAPTPVTFTILPDSQVKSFEYSGYSFDKITGEPSAD